MKVWCLFFKEKNKNSRVIVESIGPDLKEELPKVFICLGCFSKPKYSIFNAKLFQVLESVESEALHIAEAIKLNGFELIPKDPHNLLVG